VGLVVLSLASAAAATWFARRVRLLGREAAARRDQAEAALAELQESVRARERMIRGVTHDLKNPLGAARGYAELLLDPEVAGRLGGRQPEMVGAIRRNLDGALGIIHDLLNLARAESGQLEVVRAPLDCAQLLGEAVDEYRGAAHAAGHQLELVAECDGVRVVSDGARVRQILGNLLSNAIKYTPAGGRIQVTARPQLGPAPRLRVAVEDSGPGIALAEREAVFREFERLNAGDQVEGHGLGLAISRRMARLLGAELEVEDGALGGAAFVLTLPVEAG
jgi:signal transduction histidine kinase